MDTRIRWINHKGTQILLHDYRGLRGEELLKQIGACVDFTVASGKTGIFLLVNVQDTEVSRSSQLRFAEAARQVKDYCARTAVVGLTPVKRKIVSAINAITGLGARGFGDHVDARDWLAAGA